MGFAFDPTLAGASLAACEAAIAHAWPGVCEITTAALAARLRAGAPTLLLDVRAAEEHAVSRIPSAVASAPDTPADALLAAHAPAPGTLIVCACSVGLRSARQAALLAEAGWADVANLRGGIFRWAQEGRALEGGDRVHPFSAAWGLLLPSALRHEVTA
jgi:rhodanese-related sulfurtransferase